MDPQKLALKRPHPLLRKEKAPHHKPGDYFLRGPIPLDWLSAASRASGQGSGLKVAIAIWYLSGLNHQAKTVKWNSSVMRAFGIERHSAYRGLRTLEKAGLVSVERHPGRTPVVTILGAGSTS